MRCDFGDYAVSCVFHDGYSEPTDVCVDSRGIQHAPQTVLTNLGNLATATTAQPVGSSTSRGHTGRVSFTFESQKER